LRKLILPRHSILLLLTFDPFTLIFFFFHDDRTNFFFPEFIFEERQCSLGCLKIVFYRRTNHHHRERERGNDDIKLNCLLSNESTLILTFIVCCVPCQEQSTYLINFFSFLLTVFPHLFFFLILVMINTQTCPELRWQQYTTTLRKNLLFFNSI